MSELKLGDVLVIGGGIAGLASAHALLRAGAKVTVLEATSSFGGLGTTFRYREHDLDCFYHVVLPTDEHLIRLCSELGLQDRLYWREASLGFMYRRRLYPLSGPGDLLRFGAVPLWDRLRLGLTAVYAAHFARSKGLDGITAETWLARLSGKRAFGRLWKPLLEAKFGTAYSQIPALWYWASFRREKGTGPEVKGYPRFGYHGLTGALVSSLKERGGLLLENTPVERLELDSDDLPIVTTVGGKQRYDRVVSTVPLVQLRHICGNGKLGDRLAHADPGIDYQGVMNVLVLLDRSLTSHYWMPIVESEVPFDGVVETTCVLDLEDTGGHHLVYLLNYVHRDDPLFNREPDRVIDEYVDALLKLFPDLSRDSIRASFLFKAPFVEPLYSPGYGSRKPPAELVPGRVYLATTAQVYPRVTSWNSSTAVAEEAVNQMCQTVEQIS
ncbi:MAG: FAD-dependent oxidoreductase [Gemmatimonadetes bacterium]|nr:FAD-dependent oxidoreductase [Gemmatimonadota bacterium]